MIILIFGPHGSGKTALAEEIADSYGAIRISEEDLRFDLCRDLQNDDNFYVELARRANAVARLLDAQGFHCVLDISCQTPAAKKVMTAPTFKVWVDRLKEPSDLAWSNPRSEEFDFKINNGLSVKEERDFLLQKFTELI